MNMRTLWMVALLVLLPNISHAYQDILYKKDGSILKGTLLEQDFTNNLFKIQLAGGSLFVVKAEDVLKIEKEEAAIQNTKAVITPVNYQPIDSTNPMVQSPHYFPNVYSSKKNNSLPKQVFFIGTMDHTVINPIDQDLSFEFNYEGIKFGFQQSYSESIAIHYALNRGKLSSIELVNDDLKVIDSYEFDPQTYFGASAAVILSSNLSNGWQFFTGAGIAHNEYSSTYFNTSQTGITLELGMGYAWNQAQLLLHYQGYLTDDYPGNLDVRGISLQLGIYL